jgi:hypothetical protein
MINWLKKKVVGWVKEDWNKSQPNQTKTNGLAIPVDSNPFRTEGLKFHIYPATGGYVMEYSTYDRNTDRSSSNLHIIPSDQDLGQGIAHIITLEMLRK